MVDIKRSFYRSIIPSLLSLSCILLQPVKAISSDLSPQQTDDPVLNYHLMHPGGDNSPADPNAAFYLNGVYHLHYIVNRSDVGGKYIYYVHVTSPDMLHWTWEKTVLQPSFTGHGMFSGTGFMTKEGRPAIIYYGQGSDRSQIAIARNNRLDEWEKPYPVEPVSSDGEPARIRHWDPDCFLMGDTYYATSGMELLKSSDLKNWKHVGKFMAHDLPDVVIGGDISCPNFFKLGDKWMLLCISHPYGCRYYIGDWDAKTEQFVPEKHGRMTWRSEDQSLYERPRGNFFAPESLLTPDGRRVMWAYLFGLPGKPSMKSIMSLPRELSLPEDGVLRIKPLRELESLRYDPVALDEIQVGKVAAGEMKRIAELPGDAVEIRASVERSQADRRFFGLTLFADEKNSGLPILIKPDTRTIRVGTTEAPFAVADLPKGEDVELRVFIDKYLVEVFVNDRQAVVATQNDWSGRTGLNAYAFGAPTKFKKIEIWKLKQTNQGFFEARENRIWEPK